MLFVFSFFAALSVLSKSSLSKCNAAVSNKCPKIFWVNTFHSDLRAYKSFPGIIEPGVAGVWSDSSVL